MTAILLPALQCVADYNSNTSQKLYSWYSNLQVPQQLRQYSDVVAIH